MAKFFVWRWGLRGPSPAILNEAGLDEYDRLNRLTIPIMLKPEEENLPFAELIKLYPAPEKTEFPDRVSKPKKSED